MKNIDTIIFDLDGTLLNTLDDLMDAVNYVLEKENMPKRTYEEIRAFVGNGVANLMKKAVVQDTSDEKIEDMLTTFRQYYSEHSLDKTKPYEGIMDMLITLKEKGYKLAIVSNKFDKAVKSLNEHFFNGIIEVAIGEHEGINKKPSADMVNEALKELMINSINKALYHSSDSYGSDSCSSDGSDLNKFNLKSCDSGNETLYKSDASDYGCFMNVMSGGLDKLKERAVYVGDSEVDIQTAKNVGIRLIMVEWGFRDRRDMEKLGADVFAKVPEDITQMF